MIDYSLFRLPKTPRGFALSKKKRKKSKLQKAKDNSNSGYWLRKCDTLFGKIYHLYYCSNTCSVAKILSIEVDECKGHIEMAHLIPKENYLWRWDLRNMLDLCSQHHKFSRIISPHSAPIQFSIFLKEHYLVKYDFVKRHRWEAITRKADLPFTFQEKYEDLTKILKELE